MIYQLTILTIMAVGTIFAKYSVVYKAEASVFTSCADIGLNWFTFKNGYMKPDPIQWPGNATITVTLVVGRDDYPVDKSLILKLAVKRISPLGKVTVPSIAALAFGSRDFDICAELLPKYYHELCDKAGLCECPFKDGSYNIEIMKQLPSDKLIGLFVAGDYELEAQIVLENAEQNVFGCVRIKFSIINTEESTAHKEKSLQCLFYEI